MHFFPALVLAALPFLVTAVLLEEDSHVGLSIPIAKRSGLRNADGVVDIAKVKAGLRFTIAFVFHILLKRIFATSLTTTSSAGNSSADSRHFRGILVQLIPPCLS